MARGPRGAGRPRHVPQRTCVACRQGGAKRALVRVVRTAEGGVLIDPTGKKSGRGAYLCGDSDCWGAALKKNILPRALKLEQGIPAADLKALATFCAGLPPKPSDLKVSTDSQDTSQSDALPRSETVAAAGLS